MPIASRCFLRSVIILDKVFISSFFSLVIDVFVRMRGRRNQYLKINLRAIQYIAVTILGSQFPLQGQGHETSLVIGWIEIQQATNRILGF